MLCLVVTVLKCVKYLKFSKTYFIENNFVMWF